MKKNYLLLTVALVCVFSISKAQLYEYLDDPTGVYSSVATNATGTNLLRYNALQEDPACGVGFSSYKHSTSTFYTNGKPGVEFTVTPDAGYQLNVTTIAADIRHNPKGPSTWRIAYSTDGGATWTNNGTDVAIPSSNCFTTNNLAFDVDDFSTTNTLTVRIIGINAHSAINGVSTLQNIVVSGDVAVIDNDADGYGIDVDCDDINPAINPGATEICNGIDDNCDGNIDEGIDLSITISPDGVIALCKPDEVTLSATSGFDTYQWYKNGSPLTGETGNSYTTNKPAYYQVEGFIGACASGLSAVQAVAVYESPFANIFYPDGLDICVASPLLLKASYDEFNTYVWYLDGAEILGATTANYSATSTGDYYCEITNPNGCMRTTPTVTVYSGCKIGDTATMETFTIYPNPVNDQLTIAFNSVNFDSKAIVSILDITGKLLYTTTTNTNNSKTIQLNNTMIPGIYFIQIEINGNVITNKFVVAK